MYSQGMNPYNQYRATAVQTARPGKLLLMLYDGLVLSLKQAKQCIEEGVASEAHHHLIKAQEIVTELMCTLNMDYEIAHNLYQLYDYFKSRLIQANISKNAGIVEEVLSFVKELRDAWEEVVKQGVDSQVR